MNKNQVTPSIAFGSNAISTGKKSTAIGMTVTPEVMAMNIHGIYLVNNQNYLEVLPLDNFMSSYTSFEGRYHLNLVICKSFFEPDAPSFIYKNHRPPLALIKGDLINKVKSVLQDCISKK